MNLADRPRAASAPPSDAAEALFTGLLGLLLGVGLLKFGNPVILDRLVDTPKTLEEWRVFSWPVRFAYAGLAMVTLAGLWHARLALRPRGPVLLWGGLLFWLLWSGLASLNSIDPVSTRAVLPQLASCVLCLFLGNLAFSRVQTPRVFWLCVVGGFIGVLGMAAEQRLGGLEATRKAILESGSSTNLPPEYLARIQSNRVWGTLVYPNALAGAVLLLTPVSALWMARFGRRWGPAGAWIAGGALVLIGALVLGWSGSKAGWLLAMGLAVIALFHARISWGLPLRVGLAMAGLALGLVGFRWAFAEKLSRGATSVTARMDYWRAAWQGFQERPLLGHGPGGFRKVYAQRKRPESEMAQLAHNDYLQQATDTGLPGFFGYTVGVLGTLLYLYRRRRALPDPVWQTTWLGLLGWFAQGGLEFGLYIPATSWIAFTWLGWLLAQKSSALPPRALP